MKVCQREGLKIKSGVYLTLNQIQVRELRQETQKREPSLQARGEGILLCKNNIRRNKVKPLVDKK
jgi:hypothetical protein